MVGVYSEILSINSFPRKYIKGILILSIFLYIPLFLYLMTERDKSDIIQNITAIVLFPILKVLADNTLGVVIMHIFNFIISFLVSFALIFIWTKYIRNNLLIKRTTIAILAILLLFKFLTFFGLRIHIPPHYCDFQLGHTVYGDQIQAKSFRCLVDFVYKSNDPNACFLLDDPYECIIHKAKRFNDSSLCFILKKGWQQNLCLDYFNL